MLKMIIFAIAIAAVAAKDDRLSLREILQLPENIPYPDDKPCTARAHFKFYCNECTCSSTGVGASCTRMGCPPGIFNEDGSLVVPEEPKYKREANEESEDSSYPDNGECPAGTKFRYYCNECTCSSSGKGASCTRMRCPPGRFNKDGSVREAHSSKVKRGIEEDSAEISTYPPGKPCKPGTNFQYYCNACECQPNGAGAACTRMACKPGMFNEDGSMRTPQSEDTSSQDAKSCKPGTHFKSYCNSCTCSSDGMNAACTRRACPPGVFNEDGSLRITEQPEVNRASENEPHDTSYPVDKPCKAHEQFKFYCNTCTCSSTGIGASCTRMRCPPVFNEDGSLRVAEEKKAKPELEIRELPEDGSCTPGYVYKSKCNYCQCMRANAPICTMKSCPEEPPRERRSAKNWGPRYEPGSPCQPNSRFYSECNECTCSPLGNAAICTLMACNPADRP